jgi:cell division protein FtsQ
MTPGNRRVRPSTTPADGDIAAAAPPSVIASPTSRAGRVLSVLRTIVGTALVIGTSIGVAWAARRHVLTSGRFAIAAVDVSGNERRPAEAVVIESGLVVGSNVFAADLDVARAKILADPWIADVTLARRLPATVLVRVTERKPAALVALGDTFLASPDGEPFKKLEPGDPIDLPLVTGLRPESITDDREGAMRTIHRAIDLAAEFEHGGLARRAPLEEVHVGADGSFVLVVGHAAVELVLGGPPFRRKLDQATRVLAELERRGAKADAIMLDNDTRPDRVVVRMR